MNICIFGDSIVWGACDYEKGGWVERLKSYLMQNKEDVDVYNLGVSGNNTQDLLKRFDAEIAARKSETADVIIIAVGINDAQYIKTRENPRVNLKEFEENMSVLLGKAREITKRVIFVGLTSVDESKVMPIPWDETKYYENGIIQKYDAVVDEVCQKQGVPFISLFDVLNDQDLEDGLHPNSSGHKKIFDKVLEKIEPVLT
ncbi:MAG: GDSL-type esterase/lipase family protein [bacterium]